MAFPEFKNQLNYRAIRWALRQQTESLAVLVALAMHVNARGEYPYADVQICHDTGVTPLALQVHLEILEQDALVQISEHKTGAFGITLPQCNYEAADAAFLKMAKEQNAGGAL